MKVHLANSNTWSDGNEYIMGTASEVHTNALFDIYPNDTTITAEFKGNTQQNGTPSPSAPVPVVGVGYLDGAAYKIPVEIGLSTQSIDLSAVDSNRKIKKVVLTGAESEWVAAAASPAGRNRFFLALPNAMTSDSSMPLSLCTHIPLGATGATFETDNVYTITNSSVYIRLTADYNSLSDFKAYLATQYSNGSPVTIFYVLTEPVTDILNEPLQKIGTYADSISNITLTTTAGATSFGVDTAVKPSEIMLNFRGWHPKDPKESTGGEWS